MKFFNKQIFYILVILSFIIFFFFQDNLTIFIFRIFDYLQEMKSINLSNFIFLLVVFNFIYLLTPIPCTPLIIFNGFILESLGFTFSIAITIICSSILFIISKKINFIFFKQFVNKIKKKLFSLEKKIPISTFIFITRYFIPYFFHNILFGLFYKKFKYFIFFVILADIPIIYALNNFGKHLNYISQSYDLKKLLNSEFLISVFLFLIIAVPSSLIKKKFKF